MTDPTEFLPDEVLAARQAESRKESERLADLWAKAAAVSPEEKAERRRKQYAAQYEAESRARIAREERIAAEAERIVRKRLRLVPALQRLLPAVSLERLAKVAVTFRAYKQPEWSEAFRVAKKPEVLKKYAVDEPLTEEDAVTLVGALSCGWTWRVTGPLVEGMPLSVDDAFDLMLTECKSIDVQEVVDELAYKGVDLERRQASR